MRPIATDGVAWSVGWSVCLSVCQSVMIMSPAKLAEPIEMSFGMCVDVGGPRKYTLDEVQIHARKVFFRG